MDPILLFWRFCLRNPPRLCAAGIRPRPAALLHRFKRRDPGNHRLSVSPRPSASWAADYCGRPDALAHSIGRKFIRLAAILGFHLADVSPGLRFASHQLHEKRLVGGSGSRARRHVGYLRLGHAVRPARIVMPGSGLPLCANRATRPKRSVS